MKVIIPVVVVDLPTDECSVILVRVVVIFSPEGVTFGRAVVILGSESYRKLRCYSLKKIF